jgi:hypothetical protein
LAARSFSSSRPRSAWKRCTSGASTCRQRQTRRVAEGWLNAWGACCSTHPCHSEYI